MHYADGKIRFCFIVLYRNCSDVCKFARVHFRTLYVFVSVFNRTVHTVAWICLYPYPLFNVCSGPVCVYVRSHSLCRSVPVCATVSAGDQREHQSGEISEAVLERCLSLLPPQPSVIGHTQWRTKGAEAGTDWSMERTREEESGKRKTKEEKQRLKTLGIKRSGRDRSEKGMRA